MARIFLGQPLGTVRGERLDAVARKPLLVLLTQKAPDARNSCAISVALRIISCSNSSLLSPKAPSRKSIALAAWVPMGKQHSVSLTACAAPTRRGRVYVQYPSHRVPHPLVVRIDHDAPTRIDIDPLRERASPLPLPHSRVIPRPPGAT